jgi:hypothetical protein
VRQEHDDEHHRAEGKRTTSEPARWVRPVQEDGIFIGEQLRLFGYSALDETGGDGFLQKQGNFIFRISRCTESSG